MNVTRPADNYLVRHATGVAIGALTALMMILALVFWRQEIAANRAKQLVLHTHEVIGHIQLLAIALRDAELGKRGYLLTGNEIFLGPYKQALSDAPIELALIRRLTSDNAAQQENLNKMEITIQKLLDFMAHVIESKRQLKDQHAIPNANFLRGKELMDEIIELVRLMEAEENHLLSRRIEADDAHVRRSHWMTFSGIGLFYGVMVLSIWFYQRNRERIQAQMLRYTQELDRGEEELKMQQEELKASNAQREEILKLNSVLKQSNEELERFAYICSHDMQEPVRMMNSYGGLLEEKYGGRLDEKGEKYLRFIIANAQRMQKMIQDILTFSRMGREEIKMEVIDCNQIAREILSEFEATIAEHKAQIHLNDMPTLETSPTLMRVLLQNLVGNALKFQDGSKVPEVTIGAKLEGTHWRFFVRDNGIGIDPAFHSKLFTIFQRLNRKEDYPGTGIGLSTCKKFIQLCGGDIDFESAPGDGSIFYFTVPAKGQ